VEWFSTHHLSGIATGLSIIPNPEAGFEYVRRCRRHDSTNTDRSRAAEFIPCALNHSWCAIDGSRLEEGHILQKKHSHF